MVFSIKTKHMLTIQPSHWVPTYLTEMKINARTKSCTQRQVSLFLIVPNWKQPQRLMLTDELMSEQTEYPNYRNWSSLRHRLQACSHPMCLKDIILSRKSHLEIGFSIGDSILHSQDGRSAEMDNRFVAARDEGRTGRGSRRGRGATAALQFSPVTAALHRHKLDYMEPASVWRWPPTTHKSCRLYSRALVEHSERHRPLSRC